MSELTATREGWETRQTDVVVVGSGIAGLRAALAAARFGRVLVVCKGSFDQTNTYFAQGGIAIAQPEDVSSHVEDTMRVGCRLCHRGVVERVVGGAAAAAAELYAWGMQFDRAGDALAVTREGGHSAARILHAHGDATGRELERTLIERVRGEANIEIIEHCFALDLLMDEERCIGIAVSFAGAERAAIAAKQTILATGGCGAIFRETTNPREAIGDGCAMALRAGATLRDMEMIQFHPTVLFVGGHARLLVSEAVRGEGGRLLDVGGRRFMQDYHSAGELAPRDVVSRAILRQMAKTGAENVLLDVRHFEPGEFARRFPTIDAGCRSYGIDPEREPLPVRPAAHYMVGGIAVDSDGRASIAGLWACGEAASSGMHGANRLASNSLLEGLVLGEQTGHAAGMAAAGSERATPSEQSIAKALARSDGHEESRQTGGASQTVAPAAALERVRDIMWRLCGLERDGDGLRAALEELEGLAGASKCVPDTERAMREAENAIAVARCVVAGALAREESRGVHYRSDFPAEDDTWRRHVTIRLEGGRLVIGTQAVAD